jgi:drug/metabolite transporter (DMT)-like permease
VTALSKYWRIRQTGGMYFETLFFPQASHSAMAWMKFAGVSIAVAIFASIVGNTFWNRMSRLLPLTLVGQMILFETMFALLYGFAWERRLPNMFEAAAFVCVIISVTTCLAAHGPSTGDERSKP